MAKSSKEEIASLLDRYNSRELSAEELVREHSRILQTRPRLEKIMDELDRLASRGQDHLNAWREIYQALHNNDRDLIDVAFWFFLITALAHIQMATLQAAKLVENSSESVNLHYFLNFLDSECRNDFPDNWDEVKSLVERDRSQLQCLQTILGKIKAERDKTIAHHDRSLLKAGIDELSRVEVIELDSLFQTIRDMLARYHTYYYGTAPIVPSAKSYTDLIGPRGLEDLFYLARKALDDESIENVSNHVKKIRAWRRARQSVEQDLRLAADGDFADSPNQSDDSITGE